MLLRSIKRVFATGLALAIPIGVVLYVFIKLEEIFEKAIRPVAQKMGIDRILGELTLTVLAVLVLLLLVFLLGLLMRISFIAGLGRSVDDFVTKFVPSLNEIKSMAAEKLDLENETSTWKPVLLFLPEKNKYYPAFIIEELADLITLYMIIGTTIHDGEVLITPKKTIRLAPITLKEVRQYSRQYGKGYLSLISKSGMTAQTA